ncbi:MAG: hypothetical protein M3P26_04840 [Gemmatimonadota bacterium]|nr:hypothetical protein [Gemmatimonadota bacterium]
MLFRRVGDTLLALGAVIGIGAIVGYELDFIPTLPPAVLKLVIYKLIFAGGIGLLVAGAFIRRLALRYPYSDESGRRASPKQDLISDQPIASLGEQVDAAQIRPRPGTAARIERHDED